MTIGWLSFIALIVVLIVSRSEKINVGVLAIGLAWIIGMGFAKMSPAELASSFPQNLFLVIFGVTFFFSLAQNNGTLDKIAHVMLRFARGKTAAVPIIFFIMPMILSAIGPGNIGAVAILAPVAMAVAAKTGISALFMTIMLVNGANAGTFTPFAMTGIIADGLIDRLGLMMDPWREVFLPSLMAQSFVAAVCYFIFIRQMHHKSVPMKFDMNTLVKRESGLDKHQIITLIAIAILILSVVIGKAEVGFLSMLLAAVLMVLGSADGEEGIKKVPWNVIIMVCGVSTLISIMEKTGGLEIFSNLIAKLSTPSNVTGVLAFFTGIISSYSSSSGVVLPTFIPIVPGLIAKIGGGDAVAMVASINVGSHVVDVSPLSTLGALCIANAAKHENKKKLFNQLLIFGLSMSVFGAIVCFLCFSWWRSG